MATHIPAFTTTPSRRTPSTFSADMDTRLSEENARIAAANTQADENDANADAAEAHAAEAAADAGTATTKAGLTAADAIATAADRVQTGLDRVAAAASAGSAAAIAGAFVGTSTTSWTPAVGSKAFATQAGEQYSAGIFVTIVSAAAPTAFGFGQVASYAGTTLTVDVQYATGSGAHTDWNISLAGVRGATGATGAGITPQAVGFTLSGGTTEKTLTVLETGTAALLGANTFTGAQNFARTTVASHATTGAIWAAAGNQIGWTGTSTTAAFPNAPQAGAERVLICAGACSFTAGANMLIDGVASGATVTCAANDQMIVRAVSTTQFKLSRIKYDGTAQVGPSAVGNHEVVVHTGNGWGSTEIKIRRFTTTLTNVGTAITYADSDTDGARFTINETGLYALYFSDVYTEIITVGFSVNSSQLTTSIQTLDAANRLCVENGGANNGLASVSRLFYCQQQMWYVLTVLELGRMGILIQS